MVLYATVLIHWGPMIDVSLNWVKTGSGHGLLHAWHQAMHSLSPSWMSFDRTLREQISVITDWK